MVGQLAIACVLVGCAAGESATAPADSARADTSVDTPAETSADTSSDVAEAEPDTRPIPANCSNGTRDGDETDRDCGGSCPKCAVGFTCGGDVDCVSNSCRADGTCGCTMLDHCPMGSSCIGNLCRASKESCAATKASYAASDGEFWIVPTSGAPYIAYCDMQLGKELCVATTRAAAGTTREGSKLAWTATTRLDRAAGVCEVWSLKGPMGYPLGALQMVAGQTMTTCVALGFKANDAIAKCPYGSKQTDCGFGVTPMHRYGNSCSGCTMNDGDFRNYTLQGPMANSGVLTNVTGTIKLTCRVR